MLEDVSLSRPIRRLADELDDDGIVLPGDATFQQLVLEELDFCRRTPIFEGRRAIYGAMILPPGIDEAVRDAVVERMPFDVIPVGDDLSATRTYADGRAAYVVRTPTGFTALACFERDLIFETDLVQLQELTGAAIVQRTPVLDVVRLAIDDAMVSWNGRNWLARPTAPSLADQLGAGTPGLPSGLAADVLELCVHWLAPSRTGATIVIPQGELDVESLDRSTAARTPALSIANRRHYSALGAVLRQHDLAVIVSSDGELRGLSVGLRWSAEAEAAIDNERGMRHRSAQRFSYDHPDTTVFVVSEDGPVTVYRSGAVVVTTAA